MSFDFLAPHYRWLEAVLAGHKLQRCRIAWLDEVKHCRRALLIGEGNGRFLSACAKWLPDTHFTVVDASKKMLDLARAAWSRADGKESHVSFIHATFPHPSLPTGSFDLIVTNYFLDCFGEDLLPDIVQEIAQCASPNGMWLITDFSVPERSFVRQRAKAILGLSYAFFRMAAGLKARKLVAPAPWVADARFERIHRLEMEWGLLYSELWRRTKPLPVSHWAAAAATGARAAADLPSQIPPTLQPSHH